MKINYNELYWALKYRGKIPRKIKKYILGKKINRRDLKSLLNSVKIIKPSKRCFEMPYIYPYLFCPKCGCLHRIGTGNMTTHLEHWEYFYCYRCYFKVGVIDNSPFYHALEYPNFNYEIN